MSVVVALAAGLVVAPKAFAQTANENPGVLPPDARPFGKTYGEWSAAWWQYVFSIPAADNPLFDPTGAKCGVRQSGEVFFLVGTVLGTTGSTTRNNCTVSAGKMLFFPLINLEDNIAEENACPTCNPTTNLVGQPVTAQKMATLLNCLVAGGTTPFAPPFNSCQGTTGLNASLDGVSLRNLFAYRAISPVFSITVPPGNNLEQAFGYPNISGTISPVVADGFYLMLAPLSSGRHTISFGGTFGSPLNSPLSEITYHLTVVP
jgi:hypothetical protein